MENPHLFQLYDDLVVGQLISAEDFWKNFVEVIDFLLSFLSLVKNCIYFFLDRRIQTRPENPINRCITRIYGKKNKSNYIFSSLIH